MNNTSVVLPNIMCVCVLGVTPIERRAWAHEDLMTAE
jgi:hypothetical protein